MELKIKRKLIRRLAIVATVLAVVAGGFALYLETGQVDDHVVGMALHEAQGMMEHVAFLGLKDAVDYERVRKQVEEHIIQEHVAADAFVVVELYDRQQRKIISVSDPDFEQIRRFVDQLKKSNRLNAKHNYQRFVVDSLHYVLVFVPLQYGSGEPVGHFEGVYRVEPEVMKAVHNRLLLTVLQVVVVVFVTTLVLYPVILAQNRDTLRLSGDLEQANIGMLEMLGSAVAKRDRETNSHNYRVTLYAIRLAEAARMGREGIQGLVKGAFLHDVGKIGISDALLHKPSGLTNAEAKIMETHVDHGVDIVRRYAWLKDALPIVQYHHEKYDGSGYRAGLKGRDIPRSARIFTIVDVFDALTTKRPYKGPLQLEEALAVMEEERYTRFDPDLLDLFRSIAPILHQEVYLADERRLAEMLDGYRRTYFASA